MLDWTKNIFSGIAKMFTKSDDSVNPETLPDLWKKNTAKPSVSFALTKEAVSRSYVGGPSLGPAPVDADGQPMRQLCALYCSELPPLEDFPQKGILRFFLTDNEDLALDSRNPTNQNRFRVLYQEEEALLPGKNPPISAFFPIREQYFLQFSLEAQQPMSVCSWEYHKACSLLNLAEDDDQIIELLEQSFPADGHRIGGYPKFTQDDPRSAKGLQMFDTLLLQLDAKDPVVEIGDCGVLNFFIPKENLKKLDFSEVLYWWDCY